MIKLDNTNNNDSSLKRGMIETDVLHTRWLLPQHYFSTFSSNPIHPCISISRQTQENAKNKINHGSQRCKEHASRATLVHRAGSSWSYRRGSAHHQFHPSYGQHFITMFHGWNNCKIHSRIHSHTNPAPIHRPLRNLTHRPSTNLRGDLYLLRSP